MKIPRTLYIHYLQILHNSKRMFASRVLTNGAWKSLASVVQRITVTSEASHQGGATTQSDSCISKPQTASPSPGGKSCIAKLLLMAYGNHAVNTFIYGDVKVICENEKKMLVT